MSNAVAAGLRGHDYQGRLFLIYASQLLVPGSNILRVGYEYDLVRAFDDVVVYYERPQFDEKYGEVDVDFFQVKYQVRQGDEFTWKALMDPAFIHASAVSILERLRNAVTEQPGLGRRARFILVAPRPVGGELRQLLNNSADAIDMDRLFDGTVRTERAKIRESWRQHLKLATDDELRTVLEPLRIRQTRSLEELQSVADIHFAEAGLRRWSGTERANRYDDFPKKLVQSGLKLFDRDAMQDLMYREGLIVRPPIPRGQPPKRLGIRCYHRLAERMAEETDAMCCLVDCFEGRMIRDPSLWEERVRPEVERFLTSATVDTMAVDLRLDGHASVAFAAGWHFDLKAQVDIAPVQNGVVWRPDRRASRPERLWRECDLERLGDGSDIALCISSTHDVQKDARDYIHRQLRQVGALLHLLPPDGAGQTAVRDGTHAFQLAEAAVRELVPHLRRGQERGAVHLFIAAPNGLVFFLGRMARRLGEVVMYEHDFERRSAEPYVPSIRFG